jgi:hypothetical protein
MRTDLLDAQAAVDWAVEQMPMLQKRIEDWADSYSTRIAVEDDKKAYYLRANPVPAIINAETGSIINSIRTSLDLLASALAARKRECRFAACLFPGLHHAGAIPQGRQGEDQTALAGRSNCH